MAKEEKEEKVFVNTLMEPDLVEKLDEMVEDHGSDRAKFIRLLVKRRYEEFTQLKDGKQQVTRKSKQAVRS